MNRPSPARPAVLALLCTTIILAIAAARPSRAAAPPALPPDTTLILVRHGEKPSETTDALSDAGTARAARLAQLLDHAGIDTIYTSPTIRARQTAEPVAAALHIAADRRREYQVKGVKPTTAVMDLLAAEGPSHVILIVGHSDTIPDLLKTLGGWTLTVNDHDDLFIVTQPATGQPRLVRAGYPPARPDGSR